MKDIPTTQEPEALKQAYADDYGKNKVYQSNNYVLMEFMLLREAYKEKFDDAFVIPVCSDMSEVEANQTMRECLKLGNPYDYGEYPEGAII